MNPVLARLLRRSLSRRRLWVLGMLALLGATAAEVAGPYLIKQYVDEYLTAGVHWAPGVGMLLTGYLLALGLGALLRYREGVVFNLLALKVVEGVRVEAFGALMRQPVAFFDRSSTGHLVARVTQDTEAIKELFVHVLSTVISNGLLVLGVLVMMAWLDLRLMAVASLLVPLVFAAMWTYQKLAAPVVTGLRQRLAELNGQIHESLEGMTVIQQSGRTSDFIRRFAELNERYYRTRMKNVRIDALLLRALMDLISALILVGVLATFGWQSLGGVVEVGVLYAFINYLGRVVEPLIEITQRLNVFQQAMVAGGRVFELIDRPRERRPSDTDLPDVPLHEVRMENVRFGYQPGEPVLQGVDLHCPPGSMTGIVGRTGSGKSTLAQLLMRFYLPDSGMICLGGQPLADIPEARLRRRVMMVEQEPFLFNASLRENLSLGDDWPGPALVLACEQAGLGSLLNRLPRGLDTEIGARGHALSNGERHLLALARALLRRPDLLILDEATATVDSATEAAVQRAIEALRGETTLIIIAHRLSTIRAADQIVVMHHGHIAERGTHEVLLRQGGLYARLEQLQRLSQDASALPD